MKIFGVFLSVLLLILFSCATNDTHIENAPHLKAEFSEMSFDEQRKIIEEYFVDEILNGAKYTKELNDKTGVVEVYGTPLEENLKTIFPFYFEGGFVVSIRSLIYSDLIHYYYVFESGSELYAGVEVNKPLQRLTTINVGDTVDTLKKTFGDAHSQDDYQIRYYGLHEELIFYAEAGSITKIAANYLLI